MRSASIVSTLLIFSLITAAAAQNGGTASSIELARGQYASGHFAKAESLYLAALKTLEVHDEKMRASMLAELGDVYVNEEQFSEAEAAYTKALAYYRQTADNNRTALVLRNLGTIYSLEGRNTDALRVLNQALKLTKSNLPYSAKLTAEILNSLGIVFYRQQKIGKALNHFQQAWTIVTNLGDASKIQRAEILGNLGAVYLAKHDFNRAKDALQESLALSENVMGLNHPELTFTLSTLGVLYTAMGRYTEAEQVYRRCLVIYDQDKSSFELRIARVLHSLGNVYVLSGKPAEAEALFAQAAPIAQRNLAAHPEMSAVLEAYSRLLKTLGRTENARNLHLEAERARVTAGLVIHAHRATN